MLKRSHLTTLAPGEKLLALGDGVGEMDHWVYFLLRGELQVHVNSPTGGRAMRPLATVRPGELFGDLAMLLAEPRSADVIAASGNLETQVLGVDSTLFSDLEDFSLLTLPTKLVFYRNMVHSLRWKLEVYRSQYSSHPLANSHRKLKLYTGAKNCVEELRALADQARALGRILLQWNAEFCSGELMDEKTEMADFLKAMLS
ncbi:cyclic nucleotide-binding domain-containing protein [Microbulbifer aestuariivivens]|uniref:cyclic nucleotide-binding domain-containing protein n=1 Tax=Microbulbifer aestuariivivens TaxID=1908308 RepID=UPI0031E74A2A